MTLTNAPAADLVPRYDRLASQYDMLHDRWLKYAGGEAQSAIEAAVRAVATPDTQLLDVGCGTGAFARRLLREGYPATNLTLLDPSREMLRRCEDIPAYKAHGRLEDVPFSDGVFDIVTCAWVLETVSDMAGAVTEMCRVLRKDGLLCVAFCAQKPTRGAMDWVISRTLSLRGTGRFLSVEQVRGLIGAQGAFHVTSVPLAGPAAMVVARGIG